MFTLLRLIEINVQLFTVKEEIKTSWKLWKLIIEYGEFLKVELLLEISAVGLLVEAPTQNKNNNMSMTCQKEVSEVQKFRSNNCT